MKGKLIAQRTLEMKAYGKARPRVTRSGTFMPRKYQNRREELMVRFGGKLYTEEPLAIRLAVTRAMPKGWSKRKKERMDGSVCLVKPDIDNIIGAVMDAILHEDSNVYEIHADKKWGEEHTLSISVYELS